MNIYNITLGILLFSFLSSHVYAKEYVNEEFGIKFEYPNEWELTTANEDLSLFHFEYDEILLANFHVDPDLNIFNFVSLAAYANMTNQDEFLKMIRKELNTNETTNIEILDMKKYNNVRGESTILIKTIHTPLLTKSERDFDSLPASPNDRTYLLFYLDGTGYKIIYSSSSDLAYKYQDDILSIVSQIRDNKM